MVKVINIKEYMPNSSYAMYMLDVAIKDCKLEGNQVLIVIHGYGSHGHGGVIKKEAHRLLSKYKKQGNIVTFVPGEEWGDTNSDKALINGICPETIINKDIGNLNAGISVVLVYE